MDKQWKQTNGLFPMKGLEEKEQTSLYQWLGRCRLAKLVDGVTRGSAETPNEDG